MRAPPRPALTRMHTPSWLSMLGGAPHFPPRPLPPLLLVWPAQGVAVAHGGLSAEDAAALFTRLAQEEHRYVRDIWS